MMPNEKNNRTILNGRIAIKRVRQIFMSYFSVDLQFGHLILVGQLAEITDQMPMSLLHNGHNFPSSILSTPKPNVSSEAAFGAVCRVRYSDCLSFHSIKICVSVRSY